VYGWKQDQLATPDLAAHILSVDARDIGDAGGRGSSPAVSPISLNAIADQRLRLLSQTAQSSRTQGTGRCGVAWRHGSV
jgi:hypothetical protein